MKKGERIYLQEVQVAGVVHRTNADYLSTMKQHDLLVFNREPTNEYDRRAIAVMHYDQALDDSVHIGYVPRTVNQPLAALIDAGFSLHGEVVDLVPKAGIVTISIWIVP